MPRRSVLGIVSLNVGMIAEDAFKGQLSEKIFHVASFIDEWFSDGVAAVGLNEIHEGSARRCVDSLRQSFGLRVEIATCGSDALLWCAP